MRKTRPTTAILVIAILQLVFGGFGLVCDLFSGVQAAAGKGSVMMPNGRQSVDVETEVKKALETRIPAHKEIQFANVAASLVLSVMMIVSGIALLRVKVWGRLLAICYGLGSILLKISTLVFMVMFSLPAMQQVAEALEKKGQTEAVIARTLPLVGNALLFGTALTMIYPIVVLVVMLVPSTSAAFRGEQNPKSADPSQDFSPED